MNPTRATRYTTSARFWQARRQGHAAHRPDPRCGGQSSANPHSDNTEGPQIGGFQRGRQGLRRAVLVAEGRRGPWRGQYSNSAALPARADRKVGQRRGPLNPLPDLQPESSRVRLPAGLLVPAHGVGPCAALVSAEAAPSAGVSGLEAGAGRSLRVAARRRGGGEGTHDQCLQRNITPSAAGPVVVASRATPSRRRTPQVSRRNGRSRA
jgi:hypothetical protein